MPEYLAPGVYVEEVSFRSKSIEGVPTSTTGFAGLTRYGPVQYSTATGAAPRSTEPRLITSFTEFERVYGGLERSPSTAATAATSESYLAHAARAFFLNGGKRLYVSRVFTPGGDGDRDVGVAARASRSAGDDARPGGRAGRARTATCWSRPARAQANVAFASTRRSATPGGRAHARRGRRDHRPPGPPRGDQTTSTPPTSAWSTSTRRGRHQRPAQRPSSTPAAAASPPRPTPIIQEVVLQVDRASRGERIDVYDELGAHPAQKRCIGRSSSRRPRGRERGGLARLDAPDDPADPATLPGPST